MKLKVMKFDIQVLSLVAMLFTSSGFAVAACKLATDDPAVHGVSFSAKVIGFATAGEISAGTIQIEENTGWMLSGDYSSLPRLKAEINEGHGRRITSLVAYRGTAPKIGDAITVVSRHRDPAQKCRFIPWQMK